MSRWEVFKYAGLWHADEGKWATYKVATTWAEAMSHANQQALAVLAAANHKEEA